MNKKNVFWISVIAVAVFAASYAMSEEFIREFLAVDYTTMLMGFFGGIAFLLYGLGKMSLSLKSLAGDNLKRILKKLTRTKLSSLITGMSMAVAIQSSAATAMMVIGFVAVQAMKAPQAIGVILGADIGTTITVQLIAFKLNEYGLIAVATGFFMQLLLGKKDEKYIHVGHAVMGIGMIFFGIKLISDSMGIIKDIPIVIDALTHISNPLIGIFIGAVLTILMQSSAATLAVIIALASHHILPLSSAVILVLGANVGTCLTPLLGSLGKNRQALQVAVGHIGTKVAGVLVSLLLLIWLIDVISFLSFGHTAPNGMASARDVANTHMLFNIMLAVSFLPLTEHISKLLQRLLPLRQEDIGIQPQYLDRGLLETPSLALEAVKQEFKRISKITEQILADCLPTAISGDTPALNRIKAQERDVDILYKASIKYLSKLSKVRLSESNSRELSMLLSLANALENISDIAGEDIITLGRKRVRAKVKISDETAKKLLFLHKKILQAYQDAAKAALTNSLAPAQRTIQMKHHVIRPALSKLRKHQSKRLLAKEKDRFNTYSIEADIIDKMKQIFYHTRKVAKDVVEHIEAAKK